MHYCRITIFFTETAWLAWRVVRTWGRTAGSGCKVHPGKPAKNSGAPALFARRLCMNERTLEKSGQDRAKPNAQAAVLMLLVRHFPDTLKRLRRIARPDP